MNSNIDILDELPFRMSSRQASDYDSWEKYRKSNIYRITRRFLLKNIGKNKDEVYSEFVNKTKTDKNIKKAIIPLTPDNVWEWFFDKNWDFSTFYIDENNCIAKRKDDRRHYPFVIVEEGTICGYKWNKRLKHFEQHFRKVIGNEIMDFLINGGEISIKFYNKIDWRKISCLIPAAWVDPKIAFDPVYKNRVIVSKGEENYKKYRAEKLAKDRKTARDIKKKNQRKNENLNANYIEKHKYLFG